MALPLILLLQGCSVLLASFHFVHGDRIDLETIMLEADLHQLILSNISIAYNNAIVRCTGVYETGITVLCSPEGHRGVQGLLGPVQKLSSGYSAAASTVYIFWFHPPALTVIGESGPMRFYCVEVVNQTAATMTTIQSIGCNRSEDRNEETSVMLENIVCGVNYKITITRTFNVVGDGRQSHNLRPDAAKLMNAVNPPRVNGMVYTYEFPVLGPLCSCSAVIQDMVKGRLMCQPITSYPELIIVTTDNIPLNEKFDANISAGSFGVPPSRIFELSTFDVYDLNIITTGNSDVSYTVAFASGSNALGVLIILLHRTKGSTDFKKSICFVQKKTGAESMNQLSGILAGNYIALAYDVEENGEITSNSAADRKENISVIGQSSSNLSLSTFGGSVNCTSTHDELTVKVTCDYDNTTYTGFTAYLQNVQDLELSSATTTESGSSVFINGRMNGEHFVFVYPIWKSGSVMLSDMMEPAFTITTDLNNITPPSSSPDTTSGTSQDTSTLSPSVTTEYTTTMVNGNGGSSTEVVVPNLVVAQPGSTSKRT